MFHRSPKRRLRPRPGKVVVMLQIRMEPNHKLSCSFLNLANGFPFHDSYTHATLMHAVSGLHFSRKAWCMRQKNKPSRKQRRKNDKPERRLKQLQKQLLERQRNRQELLKNSPRKSSDEIRLSGTWLCNCSCKLQKDVRKTPGPQPEESCPTAQPPPHGSGGTLCSLIVRTQ